MQSQDMMACQPRPLEEESNSECSSDPLVVAQLATTNPGKGLQPETSDDGRERAVGAHSSNLVATKGSEAFDPSSTSSCTAVTLQLGHTTLRQPEHNDNNPAGGNDANGNNKTRFPPGASHSRAPRDEGSMASVDSTCSPSSTIAHVVHTAPQPHQGGATNKTNTPAKLVKGNPVLKPVLKNAAAPTSTVDGSYSLHLAGRGSRADNGHTSTRRTRR